MNILWRFTRNRYLFFADMGLVVLAYALAAYLCRAEALQWYCMALSVALFVGFIYLFGGYRICWIYAGTRDYCRIVAACIGAGGIIAILSGMSLLWNLLFRMSLVTVGIASVGIIGMRMGIRGARRLISISTCTESRNNPKRVLIIGAGRLGVLLAKDINSNEDLNYYILGFVDDDKRKRHTLIEGVEVLGTTNEIGLLCQKLKPDEIIFAISSADAEVKQRILHLCAETHCSLKMVSGFADALHGKKSTDFLRKVEVEDLLGREMICLDNSAISQKLKDQVVMVTGGGGSIGSELCRQIMRFSPKKLVILDIYENNVFDLENELKEQFPDGNIEIVIASVRDQKRLLQVFQEHRPYMVFHAAAHKHVPMMESNAMEAVKNNVFGTWNAVRCASQCGVGRFILISTDKAVNPTNVMGATKRLCEMIVQAMQTVSETEFAAVRFGNVLDSNGSVLPRFKKQLEKGGPLTVTHPEITRFFMTIPEAAQLILQAATFAQGGEIFVLDMGKPIRIYDLAKNLIRLSGLRPGKDIEIVFTGLRPGEKLYEELLMDEEGLQKTAHGKIFIGQPFFHSMEELEQKLQILETALVSEDNQTVREAVAQVVPTYRRAPEQSEKNEEGPKPAEDVKKFSKEVATIV